VQRVSQSSTAGSAWARELSPVSRLQAGPQAQPEAVGEQGAAARCPDAGGAGNAADAAQVRPLLPGTARSLAFVSFDMLPCRG
jgi:hypothetical protein